jgi:malate dehydrogenase (oxaloacetate-decarboxylating)(NADP+)
MKRACVVALADMARSDARFSKDYIVPGLLDPRLLIGVTPKIATAAWRSGVARKQLVELEYADDLKDLAESLL